MQRRDLISYFKEEFFIPELRSKTKKAVLEELLDPLVASGGIRHKSIVLETLHNRETLGSTGIGKGIAVPHCRSVVVSDIFIVVGISHRGIPFDSIDKKDVNLFFLIVAPPHETANLYLPILGSIVELVKDSKSRRALLKVNGFSDF